jgi:hypothetical protein
MGLAVVSKNLACHANTVGRHGRKNFVLSVSVAFALLASMSSLTLCAQTNASSSTAQGPNRYLFIVETSRAMRPRAGGVFKAMKQALDSSLNRQIRQGDLVGIWTFNEAVYQDVFPSQEWSQATQLAFAVRLPTFADPELYQKRSRLDKVVPEMLKVMAGSDNVTIILVSTGDGVMEGTRFSAQINSAWKDWYDEQDGVHMPLQTVMRARNGQPTDWSLTPAPRPIELPSLAGSKPAEEKKNNPAAVILESGLVTNQPASTGTEQQVAFSVWALGKTGPIASTTSAQKISTQPVVEDSAPPETTSASEVSTNKPLGIATAGSEPSNPAVSLPTGAPISNAPPAETGKPVELVFVTNALAQPATAPESPINESTPTATLPPVSTTPPPPASQTADLPARQPLVAQARAADPSQEEKPEPALAAAPRGFLRDNIQPLALMIVAGFGALYCFRMWLRTNARPNGNAFSLTRTEPDQTVEQES